MAFARYLAYGIPPQIQNVNFPPAVPEHGEKSRVHTNKTMAFAQYLAYGIPPQIRWGIIGVGDVCEVKAGPAFQKCVGSSLQAVMRRTASLAEDFAARHKVPSW